ncbi:unnamed protein product [Camellia sinensis]
MPTLALPLIFILFVSLFSLYAISTITYITYHDLYGRPSDFVTGISSFASELGIGVCDCRDGIEMGVRAVVAEHVFDEGDETSFVVFDVIFWGYCDGFEYYGYVFASEFGF